jgi:hypothetical protein
MDDAFATIAAFLGLMFVGFVLGCAVGAVIGHDAERAAAIKAHAARWEVDAKTGETRFVYGGVTK